MNIYDINQKYLSDYIQKNLVINENDSGYYRIKLEINQIIQNYSFNCWNNNDNDSDSSNNSNSNIDNSNINSNNNKSNNDSINNMINNIKQALSNIKSPYKLLDRNPNIQYNFLKSPNEGHEIFNPLLANLEYIKNLIKEYINDDNKSNENIINQFRECRGMEVCGSGISSEVSDSFNENINGISENSSIMSENENFNSSNENSISGYEKDSDIINGSNEINGDIYNLQQTHDIIEDRINNYDGIDSDSNKGESKNNNNNLNNKLSQLFKYYSKSNNDFIKKMVDDSKNANFQINNLQEPPVLINEDFQCYKVSSLDLAHEITLYDSINNHEFKINENYIQDGGEHKSKVNYKVYHDNNLLPIVKYNSIYQFHKLLFPSIGLNSSTFITPTQLLIMDKLKVFPHYKNSPVKKKLERLKSKYKVDSIKKVLQYEPKFRAKIENELQNKKKIFIEASLVRNGRSLTEYLKNPDGPIDIESYSFHFISSLLFLSTDYSAENLIVENGTNYIISKNIDKVLEGEEIESYTDEDAYIGLKNILFTLDSLMSKTVHHNIREQFIKQNPSLFMLKFLNKLKVKELNYESLFSILNIPENEINYKLKFSDQSISFMYERFKMIKELLLSNSSITHKELLKIVLPLTSTHYEYLSFEYNMEPLKRIESIDKKEFKLKELLLKQKRKIINDSKSDDQIKPTILLIEKLVNSINTLIQDTKSLSKERPLTNSIDYTIIELISFTNYEDLIECKDSNEKCNELCNLECCKSNSNIFKWFSLIYLKVGDSNLKYNKTWFDNKRLVISRLLKSNAPITVIENIKKDFLVQKGRKSGNPLLNIYDFHQSKLSLYIREYLNEAYYYKTKIVLSEYIELYKENEKITDIIKSILNLVKPFQELLSSDIDDQQSFMNSPSIVDEIFVPILTNLENILYIVTFIHNISLKNRLLKLYVYYSKSHHKYINELVERINQIPPPRKIKNNLKKPPLLLSEDLNYYEFKNFDSAYDFASYCLKEQEYERITSKDIDPGLSYGRDIHKKIYSKVGHSGLLNPAKENAVYQFYKFFFSKQPNEGPLKESESESSFKTTSPSFESTISTTLISPTQLLAIGDILMLSETGKRKIGPELTKHGTIPNMYKNNPQTRQQVERDLEKCKLFLQASLFREGLSLERYLLESTDESYNTINLESYSAHIIASLLLLPTDYKATNLRVENETNNIIGIDNDASMDANEIEITIQHQALPRFRNVLFAMKPLMSKPIHPNVILQVIQHNPSLFIFIWLLALKFKQSNYESLLSQSLQTLNGESLNLMNLYSIINFPMKFKRGWIKLMYFRFKKIKELLMLNKSITHQDLFEQILPLTSKYYSFISKWSFDETSTIMYEIYGTKPTMEELLEHEKIQGTIVEKELAYVQKLIQKSKLFLLDDNQINIDETIKEFLEYIDSNDDLVLCKIHLENVKRKKEEKAKDIYRQIKDLIKDFKNKNPVQIPNSSFSSDLKFDQFSNFINEVNLKKISKTSDELESLLDIDYNGIPEEKRKLQETKVLEICSIMKLSKIKLINITIEPKHIRFFSLDTITLLDLTGSNLRTLGYVGLSTSKLEFTQLQKLKLNQCSNLSTIKIKAPLLLSLEAMTCVSLYTLDLDTPLIYNLNLKNSIYTPSISFQIFNNFVNLENLDISKSIYKKLDFSLPKLKSLQINKMKNLEELKLKAQAIKVINLEKCNSLKSIKGFSGEDSNYKNLNLCIILDQLNKIDIFNK